MLRIAWRQSTVRGTWMSRVDLSNEWSVSVAMTIGAPLRAVICWSADWTFG